MKASAVRSGFTSATEIAAQVRKVFSNKPGNTVEDAAIKFIDNHVPELQRLNEAAGYTQWNLLTLGGEDVSKRKPDEGEDIFKQRLEKLQAEYEDVANRAEKAVLDYKNDPDRAKAIVSIYGDRGKLSDEFLRRQVQLAYPVFSEYTIDPALQEEILRRTNRLVMMYGDFMPVVSDKKIADSEIDQLIRQSTDPKQAIELVKAKLAI